MALPTPTAWHVALIVSVASMVALPASGQEIRWPRVGHHLRVTTLPGPPGGVLEGLRDLGLPWDVRNSPADGRVRFRASLAEATPSTLTLTGGPRDAAGSFRLTNLGLVERHLGRGHHARTGAIAGGVVGALAGTVIVGGLGGGPQDYLAGAAVLGAPFALVGMLFGRILLTDIWDPVYRNPEYVP